MGNIANIWPRQSEIFKKVFYVVHVKSWRHLLSHNQITRRLSQGLRDGFNKRHGFFFNSYSSKRRVRKVTPHGKIKHALALHNKKGFHDMAGVQFENGERIFSMIESSAVTQQIHSFKCILLSIFIDYYIHKKPLRAPPAPIKVKRPFTSMKTRKTEVL